MGEEGGSLSRLTTLASKGGREDGAPGFRGEGMTAGRGAGVTGLEVACIATKAEVERTEAHGEEMPALGVGFGVVRARGAAAALGMALNLLRTSSMGSRRRRWTSFSKPSSK